MKFVLPYLLLAVSAVAENPLSVKLVSDTTAIQAGATFTVGIHLKPPQGFHTYWKHPGIVGVATSVEWTLPAGFKAGDVQWPAPEAVKMARYTAQGYPGETLLMVPVTAPASVSEQSVTLTAHLSWMCCGTQCHPANKVPFSITLPVAASSDVDPDTRPLFARFRAMVPVEDKNWRTKVDHGDGTIVLTLTPIDPTVANDPAKLGKVRFFTADGSIDSNGEQRMNLGANHSLRIELPRSAGSPPVQRLSGTLVAEGPWRRGGSSRALLLP